MAYSHNSADHPSDGHIPVQGSREPAPEGWTRCRVLDVEYKNTASGANNVTWTTSGGGGQIGRAHV